MDDNSLSDSNVKVAVRVRPMNRRGEYNVTETTQPLISLVFTGQTKLWVFFVNS